MDDLEQLFLSLVASSAAAQSAPVTSIKLARDLTGLTPAERRQALLVKHAFDLQEIGNKAKEFGGKALDEVQRNRALQVGLAAAALGGGMTFAAKRRPEESRTHKTMRVLGNAALAGGLGGGAALALGAGAKEISNALPADDVDPLTAAVTSPTARAGAGVLGGLVGGFFPNKGGISTQNSALTELYQRLAVKNDFKNWRPEPSANAAANAVPDAALRRLEFVTGLKNRGMASGNSLEKMLGMKAYLKSELNRVGHSELSDLTGAHVQGISGGTTPVNPLRQEEIRRLLEKAGINAEQGWRRRAASGARSWLYRGGSSALKRFGAGAAVGASLPEIVNLGKGVISMVGGSDDSNTQ